METIVFDGSSMRHSVSQCHCVSPVPTAAGLDAGGAGKEKVLFPELP